VKRWMVVLAAVLAVAGLLTWAAFATGLVVVKKRDVPIPPASATPQQVVQAYVDALDAHDCATAEALAPGEGGRWCHATRSGRVTDLSAPFKDGRRIDIGVTLSVSWRLFHNDHSIYGSTFAWGYILSRTTAGWRIVDQGTG